MMYRYIVTTALTGFNGLVLSMIVASNSASAPSLPKFNELNFNELNQSRQFFDEGHELLEREIKWLQQDVKLPQIKLPQNLSQFKTMSNSYSVDARAKLKPISKTVNDLGE
jgi:hypothetical protein